MEIGVHLPQLDIVGAPLSYARLAATVSAARECGAVALSANDHFAFGAPWLDGLTALASVAAPAGDLQLMTTVSLPALRGPVPLAAALAALSCLSGGGVVAGVGPGSSPADHQLVEQPFDGRWARFERAVITLRTVLGHTGAPVPAAVAVARSTVPVWIASWGSPAGLRRVARLGDGWLASGYHQTPESFGTARRALDELCAQRGRPPLPHALVTVWWFVTESAAERETALVALGRVLGRDPDQLRSRVCVGPAQFCAELLHRYAEAGCRRVHVWPLADEPRQLSLLRERVLPRLPSP